MLTAFCDAAAWAYNAMLRDMRKPGRNLEKDVDLFLHVYCVLEGVPVTARLRAAVREQLTTKQRERESMGDENLKVWRNDKTKQLYHDKCFNEGESREGYTLLAEGQFEEDDECASCGASLASEKEEDDVEDDDLEDDDPDDPDKQG